VAVAALITASPSPAGAAVTIGATGGNGAADCPPDFTWAQDSTAVGSPTYVVPAGGGVITSWSHDRGPASATAQLRLKVFRKTAPNTYLTMGQSDFETLSAAGVNSFATRVKVEGGDILGFRLTAAPISCRRSGSTGDMAVASGPAQPDPPIGSSVSFGSAGAYLLNLAATVEPDSDSDGFGDETQDKCVGTAGAANGCPSTVAIGKLKQKGSTKVKVTVTVPGAGTLAIGSANDKALASASTKSLKAVTRTITGNTKQQLTLTLKLTKSAIGKLVGSGKLKLKVKAVYTPVGGPAGSQTKRKELKS
jgi:hypothetical protein